MDSAAVSVEMQLFMAKVEKIMARQVVTMRQAVREEVDAINKHRKGMDDHLQRLLALTQPEDPQSPTVAPASAAPPATGKRRGRPRKVATAASRSPTDATAPRTSSSLESKDVAPAQLAKRRCVTKNATSTPNDHQPIDHLHVMSSSSTPSTEYSLQSTGGATVDRPADSDTVPPLPQQPPPFTSYRLTENPHKRQIV
ncbi:hypothetical protein DYB28_002587 [Aphanomyces astaci]|uniref:Uncharacterized protein n=1 Tax=Aphanomyces astaci TaxID=112090 RepID=A0A9X8E4F6_APHAT|nr:hypothetical protein DYB28_002587 [Aphanomyces astaci]